MKILLGSKIGFGKKAGDGPWLNAAIMKDLDDSWNKLPFGPYTRIPSLVAVLRNIL